MTRLSKIYLPNTSLRLNVSIVLETVMLLFLSLTVLLFFSRGAMKKEANRDVEQTLEATVMNIDNVLMSVEQSTYNIFTDLQGHIDDPERMKIYSREIVRANPHVVGCAIVFRPGYYQGHDLYMAYAHRKGGSGNNRDETEMLDSYANRPYTEQAWYLEPMAKRKSCWVGPLKNEDAEDEALITFCLPIFDKGECVGVVATDLALGLLTEIIHNAKMTAHGYSVLLNDKGSYIVHPDKDKLDKQTVYHQNEKGVDESVREAASAMMSGKRGSAPFTLNGKKWYVFFQPFNRETSCGQPMEKLGWSAGIVYLEKDVMGSYDQLFYLVLVITLLSMLLFFMLCRALIRRQLRPLRMMTRSAQRIAEGDYNEKLPNAQDNSEIGKLQDNFLKMQHSLAAKSKEMEALTRRLKQRNTELNKAYSKAHGADYMKATFLHYMTTQMTNPADQIERSVMKLVNNYETMKEQEADHEVDVIKQQSDIMIDLLNNIIKALNVEAAEAEKEFKKGKEEYSHEQDEQ